MNKILLIVGIAGFLLFALVTVICLLLPLMTGHASLNETIWADIGSCFCSFVFLVISGVGMMLSMKARKRARMGP